MTSAERWEEIVGHLINKRASKHPARYDGVRLRELQMRLAGAADAAPEGQGIEVVARMVEEIESAAPQ